MIEKKAFEANHEEDPTLNNMITCSSQMDITQLIDASIKDAINNKNTLVLKMESVINLMREVECEEKAAAQAKEQAAKSSLYILVKLDECKKALRHAEEMKDNLVRKLYVHKAILATKMEVFQLHLSHLLDDGDSLYQVLDEMSRSLETRLTSALMKKKLAMKKKQENEDFAGTALACEKIQMEKVDKEFKSLKQEAVEISKLLEFVIDGGQVLDTLHDEISDKRHNVNQLREELDQGSELGGLMSILVTSSSSLKSYKTDDNKNVVFEVDVNSPPVMAEEGHEISTDAFIDLKSTIECNDFVENPRDVETREENKLCGKVKKVKKVKVKKNLHGNKKRVKKVRIKGLQAISKRTATAKHRGDSSDDIEIATLKILLVMIIVVLSVFCCLDKSF